MIQICCGMSDNASKEPATADSLLFFCFLLCINSHITPFGFPRFQGIEMITRRITLSSLAFPPPSIFFS